MRMRHILFSFGMTGVVFTAIVGAIGSWGVHALGDNLEDTVHATEATQLATLGDMMHEGIRGDVFQALMGGQSGQTEFITQAQKEVDEHGKEFLSHVHELQKMPLGDNIKRDVDALIPVVTRYAEAGTEICALAAKDVKAATDKLPAFIALFNQLETDQIKVIKAIEANTKTTEQDARTARDHAQWIMICTTAIGAVLLFAAALSVTRYLMSTLGGEPFTVRKLLHRVASGDLGFHVRVQPGDTESLMAGLADMVNHLRGTVERVRNNADSVSTASSQVSAGSADLSSRTQDQAAALERSASALEQLSATVGHNADSAVEASQLAQGASSVAAHGGDVVSNLVNTMQDINHSSQKIADIIGVIDGIAFQTNILALNAAVEAARAGEQGRGFAVVAGEVRNLAQRSAEAAREIKTLITTSVERAAVGAEQANQAGSTMQEIVSAISRVNDIIGEISSASREQTAGIAQVADAVNQMDQGTQSNAALVEETAAAAESLSNQATQLAQSVAAFKIAN